MNSKKKIREFVLLEKSTPRKGQNFDHHLNRDYILPYIYTHTQVIGMLVDSIMNIPVPKKIKGHFTVTKV